MSEIRRRISSITNRSHKQEHGKLSPVLVLLFLTQPPDQGGGLTSSRFVLCNTRKTRGLQSLRSGRDHSIIGT
jgi:hypothetical protein